ncbi:MAG: acetate--CoA ligase [Pelagibacteraceae bacterium TMED237]|nr:MAG: acetate--CoA ligase [Pelagibacteraceae bacterium TMED237]|tara:strand:- start:856 stop:2937 length:2082 start_codon:yes stop_codon:yes gene_type:complete
MPKRKKKKRKIRRKRKSKTKKRLKITKRKSSKKKKIIKKKSSKETRDTDGNIVFKVTENWAKQAYANKSQYEKKYKLSIKNNEEFWKKEGKRINWIKPYKKIKDVRYSKEEVKIKWYYDGTLNASANCIDRHLEKKGNKTAIIWVGDDPSDSKKISYKELHKNVCKAANGLRSLGIQKGDKVTIYLTMIPELAYVMLACARIGAVHSIIFGGFSPDSIATRINDCESDYVITADEGVRGGKIIPLKKIADEAMMQCPNVKKCVVVKRTGNQVDWNDERDVSYDEIIKSASDKCAPEEMNAEDPLFILYTSGSTGKPKGVLHTTGGYMVYASMTHQYIFDYKNKDIYWCTADIGWVTGHSYIIYGPLSNGATTIMFEGVPNYPDSSRWWQIVDKYKVNIFYTAPTAIRALMREGDGPVKKTSRKSLKLLGTVGEPINPEAWMWYYKTVGEKKCPIVDTWWQTETGGILISPQPGAINLKPGSATKPFYGIKPAIVDESGKILKGACKGRLCMTQSWPGQMRTVYGDHQRFIDTYFSQFDGKYFTGDGCRRDKDGYYWITGRVDDVIIVSGHNLGTAEIESAFVAHTKVAEAAVVGYPHDIKGNGLYCYVTLNAGEKPDGDLERELKLWVRKQIGPIATPDHIQFAPGLPKTRSGKIMRRILRKIAANEHHDLGDTTTLADPTVVDSLVDNRRNK